MILREKTEGFATANRPAWRERKNGKNVLHIMREQREEEMRTSTFLFKSTKTLAGLTRVAVNVTRLAFSFRAANERK